MLVKYLLDATVFFRESICHRNVHFKTMTSWNGIPPQTPQTVLSSPWARLRQLTVASGAVCGLPLDGYSDSKDCSSASLSCVMSRDSAVVTETRYAGFKYASLREVS